MNKRILIATPVILMQSLSFAFIVEELANGLNGKLVIGTLLVLALNICLLEMYRLMAENY